MKLVDLASQSLKPVTVDAGQHSIFTYSTSPVHDLFETTNHYNNSSIPTSAMSLQYNIARNNLTIRAKVRLL